LPGAKGLSESGDDVLRYLGVGVHPSALESDEKGHFLVIVGDVGDMAGGRDRDLSYHAGMAPPYKPVREYLVKGGGGPITVRDLAQRIDGTIEQVKRLIEYKYLMVVMEKTDPGLTVLSCPNEEGIKWLKNMNQPIQLKALVPLDDVHRLLRKQQGRMLRRAVERTRRVCLSYQIPIYLDPVYGELLTIEGFSKLVYYLGVYRCPVRTDQTTMLTFLLNALSVDEQRKNRWVSLKVPRYTKRLSMEIGRIAGLKEPQRTLMAVALYENWSKARRVQECLRKLEQVKRTYESSTTRRNIEAIERMDLEMERMIEKRTSD